MNSYQDFFSEIVYLNNGPIEPLIFMMRVRVCRVNHNADRLWLLSGHDETQYPSIALFRRHQQTQLYQEIENVKVSLRGELSY